MTGPRFLLVLLGLALPLVVGWQIACLLVPLPKETARLFRWTLGSMLGLALASLTYLVWRIFGGAWTPPYLLGETAFFLIVLFVLALTLKKSSSASPVLDGRTGAPGWLKISALVTVLAAGGILTMRILNEPHGGWDAWAIWNLKARFLFRSGTEWRSLFSPVLDWAHPDYPLLLPATIARWWTFAGVESLVWPALATFLQLFLPAGLLAGILLGLRGRTIALIAVLCSVGTFPIVEHAAFQGPDLLVGTFLAASLACLALFERTGGRGPLVLAGACAGFAAWTKNEGLLFLPVLAAAWLLAGRRWRAPKTAAAGLGWMAMGAFPGLAAVALIKLSVPGGNDLVAGVGAGGILVKLTDPGRYWLIAKAFAAESFKLVMPAALIAAWGLTGFRRSPDNRRGALLCLTAAAGMLLGYGLVYLLTPYDLAWHLSTSASRLLMGVWPAALLGMLLLFRFEE